MLPDCYHWGMARTQKVSVALERNALAAAKKLALAEGSSLSALLMKLLSAHLEREAKLARMGAFMEAYAPNARVTAAEVESLRNEMTAPLKPIRRTKRKRAA